MLRIKDPRVSLPFYTGVLGMQLLKKLHFPEMRFSLYFLGFALPSSIPQDETERSRWTFSQPATLELTHNWGTESEEGLLYHRFRSFLHFTAHVNDCSVATVIPEGLATLGLLCQMLMKLVPGLKRKVWIL